jgi:hypothetical protein
MSLAIQIDKVTHVLLPCGWYEVKNRSFDTDAYEFVEGERPLGGGDGVLVPYTGFRFVVKDDSEGPDLVIKGPLTSVLAVREEQ